MKLVVRKEKVNKFNVFKKFAIFQHLTKVGCYLLTKSTAVSKESDEFI